MKKINEDIRRMRFLMEIVDEIELDESEVNEEGEESTDTTTDTSSDTSSDTGSSLTPWKSGVARGPGNPITSAKREDKVTRGKGNPVGTTKWASGRTMGPTGKNYKV